MVARSRSKRLAALGWPPLPALGELQAEAPPPSSALINVILQYADIQHVVGDGRIVLRLSVKRMKDPVIKSILGCEIKRLGQISIIWDEEEGEIVRVHDAAIDDDTPMQASQEMSELDRFELTEAALAYIEASAQCR